MFESYFLCMYPCQLTSVFNNKMFVKSNVHKVSLFISKSILVYISDITMAFKRIKVLDVVSFIFKITYNIFLLIV